MVGDPANLSGANVVTGSCSPNRIGDVEMSDTTLPQLSELEIKELYRKDPAAVNKARIAGQFTDVFAGKNHCPTCTCGRTNQEAK